MSTKETIYKELIEQFRENVNQLNEKLTELDAHTQTAKSKKTKAAQIPIKFKETVDVTEDTPAISSPATDTVMKGDDEVRSKNLGDFTDRLAELRQETDRLAATDFRELFKSLQSELIDKARNDIAIELKKFENKSAILQDKINSLSRESDRLSAIDLENHYAKNRQSLADILGVVNAIGHTLAAVTQSLYAISQSLGALQTSTDDGHRRTTADISLLKTDLHQHLKLQGEEIRNNIQLLESRLQSVSEQNERLQRQQKTSLIVQILGIVIIGGLVAFLVFAHPLTQ